MKGVKQTKTGGADVPPEERGDCYPACIASILEVPLEAIGNHHHAAPHWFDAIQQTLAELGVTVACLERAMLPPRCYWIACVPSLNLAPGADGKIPGHAIVMKGSTVAWDPSTADRQYIVDAGLEPGLVRDAWALVPLETPASEEIADLVEGMLQQDLEEAQAEAEHARRLLAEFAEQFLDIFRGIRDLDELRELAKGLPYG